MFKAQSRGHGQVRLDAPFVLDVKADFVNTDRDVGHLRIGLFLLGSRPAVEEIGERKRNLQRRSEERTVVVAHPVSVEFKAELDGVVPNRF